MIYAIAAIGLAVAAFICWRYTSVSRGARQRNEKLLAILDPIGLKLSRRELVTPEEIAALSRQPQFRPMLYRMLKEFERLDLFPPADLSLPAQGTGILAYWLMHPNELQDAPSDIEFVEEAERNIAGEPAKFLVFRYRMPSGHWAAKYGWLLGLAGPFIENDVAYSGLAGGFSRCGNKFGQVSPAELVDWFIGMVTRKRK